MVRVVHTTLARTDPLPVRNELACIRASDALGLRLFESQRRSALRAHRDSVRHPAIPWFRRPTARMPPSSRLREVRIFAASPATDAGPTPSACASATRSRRCDAERVRHWTYQRPSRYCAVPLIPEAVNSVGPRITAGPASGGSPPIREGRGATTVSGPRPQVYAILRANLQEAPASR